jgi:hypothetical protein
MQPSFFVSTVPCLSPRGLEVRRIVAVEATVRISSSRQPGAGRLGFGIIRDKWAIWPLSSAAGRCP